MRRFQFKLQPLLDQRIEAERVRRREVGAVDGRRVELERAIRARQAEVAGVKDDMRRAMRAAPGAPVAPVDAGSIRFGAAASFRAQARAREAAVALAGVLRRLEAARAALREAAAARRSLELLKERREAAWRAALDRAEAAELDDITTGRAARAPRPMGGGP